MRQQSKIVSFDFDNTLSRIDVQNYAKELIDRGINVYIITSRYDELHKHKYNQNPSNDDLYLVSAKLGIPKHKIRFTCMDDKASYLGGTHVLWHLDDDHVELNLINKNTKVKGVSVNSSSYKAKCNKLLEL